MKKIHIQKKSDGLRDRGSDVLVTNGYGIAHLKWRIWNGYGIDEVDSLLELPAVFLVLS